MKKIGLLILLIIAANASASSISDLNVKGFEGRISPPSTSLKSPFLPQKPSKQDLLIEDIRLSGIVIGPVEAYALISGYTVKEGDEIAGYKVKVIERDHVVLKQLDQIQVLKLE